MRQTRPRATASKNQTAKPIDPSELGVISLTAFPDASAGEPHRLPATETRLLTCTLPKGKTGRQVCRGAGDTSDATGAGQVLCRSPSRFVAPGRSRCQAGTSG